MSFHRYLGLKHEFGADPRDGKAADCILLAFAILDDAGVYRPELDPKWFDMARSSLWQPLEQIWLKSTVPVDEEPFSVSMHWNRPRLDHPRLGFSTLVENDGNKGVVMINARKGVVWVPLATPGLQKFNFRKFVK